MIILQDDSFEKNKVILLVEDDENLLTLYEMFLKFNDFLSYTAVNGHDALNLMMDLSQKNLLPDVIICDILMPKLNGIEFYSLLKKNPLWKKIPFIFLTGLFDDKLALQCNNIGIDYIIKPFDEELLLALIKKKILSSENKKINNYSVSQKIDSNTLNTLIMSFK